MKPALIITLVLVTLLVPFALATQVQNESLANAIVDARRKNEATLARYNWNSRTELLDNGKLMDLRIDLVSVASNGQWQRTLLNDEPGKVPGLFLRRAIAQNQQKRAEETAASFGLLLDQYTLAGAGKIAAFIIGGQIQPITAPGGQSLVQVTGTSVIVPGDSVTMTFDGATLLPTSMTINTTFNGDPASVSATFLTMRSGPNCIQYATAQIPSKNLTVMIHNYDFVPID